MARTQSGGCPIGGCGCPAGEGGKHIGLYEKLVVSLAAVGFGILSAFTELDVPLPGWIVFMLSAGERLFFSGGWGTQKGPH